MSLEAFSGTWADTIFLHTSEFIVQLPSAVTSLLKISVPVPVAAIHAQSITTPPPCLTDELLCFRSWAVLYHLYTLFLPSLSYRFILVLSVHNTSFKYFFTNWSGHPVFVGNKWFTSCSVASVFLFSYKDTPASWRLFLICWTGVWGFFFTIERILLSSAVEVFLGLPNPLQLQTSPVHSFFLMIFQTVDFGNPNVWPVSLIV